MSTKQMISNNIKVLQRYVSLSIFFIEIAAALTLIFLPIIIIDEALQSMAEPSFANATKYILINKWGEEGDGEGQFNRPHDLEFSPSEDKLYIADRDNSRIQVFDKNGTFLFQWGEDGKGDGQFRLPYGLDVDKEGNVWVADRLNNNIQKFDAEGNFILSFGSGGSEPGQFKRVRGAVVDDALKYIYTADSDNHRIQKFDINGTFIDSFGTLGNGPGQLNTPTTILLDSKGYLYVSERGNERVQKFDTDGNSILMWGSRGSGPNQFCEQEHLGVDKFDNIYVNDPQLGEECSQEATVKKFDSQGNFITQWIIASEGEVNSEPEHPEIDSDGNVYVSARGLNEIQVYKPVE